MIFRRLIYSESLPNPNQGLKILFWFTEYGSSKTALANPDTHAVPIPVLSTVKCSVGKIPEFYCHHEPDTQDVLLQILSEDLEYT